MATVIHTDIVISDSGNGVNPSASVTVRLGTGEDVRSELSGATEMGLTAQQVQGLQTIVDQLRLRAFQVTVTNFQITS